MKLYRWRVAMIARAPHVAPAYETFTGSFTECWALVYAADRVLAEARAQVGIVISETPWVSRERREGGVVSGRCFLVKRRRGQ